MVADEVFSGDTDTSTFPVDRHMSAIAVAVLPAIITIIRITILRKRRDEEFVTFNSII
ncbi:MAG: hypothetical protein K2G05_05425 [Duncaniella sp.]|nr:hypothetical protein [Duncaniella sp.]